jgi:predicted Zn-dependent peptidase
MAFKGAKDTPGERIDAAIEETGGIVSAATLPDATHYWASVSPEGAVQVIQTLPRILHEPALDTEVWERERKVILEEIDRAGADAEAEARHALAAKLYGPFASPASGTADAIRALTPEAIRSFHRRCYRPDRIVMVVTGRFDIERIQKAARDALTALPAASGISGAPVDAVPAPIARTANDRISRQGTVAIGMGFAIPGDGGPALDIACTLLRTRLLESLSGIAGDVQVVHPWQRAQLITVVVTGPEVNADRIESTMKTAIAALGTGITDADLKAAVRKRQWTWWIDNESPTAQARTLGLAVTLGDLDAATLATTRLSLLTADDVRTAANLAFRPVTGP